MWLVSRVYRSSKGDRALLGRLGTRLMTPLLRCRRCKLMLSGVTSAEVLGSFWSSVSSVSGISNPPPRELYGR